MRTTLIEPTIAEMLSDPIVGLLMEHDGVSVEHLQQLLGETRRRLRTESVEANWSGSQLANRRDDTRLIDGPGHR